MRHDAPLAGVSIPTALALALTLCACRGPTRWEPPRHVFLITVDTLRADRMGYHGYPRETTPFLDRLAARSVIFERAIAQWPKTGPSLASLFTGRYPQTTGLTHTAALRLPEEYLTLPELFARSGYTALGVVSNGVLGRHLGWDAGFTEYRETLKLAPEPSDDPIEYRKYLNARRVNAVALPLLRAHRDAEHLFAWIHYSDPHAPYLLPEGVANRFLDDPWYHGTELAEFDDSRHTQLGDHQELRYYVAQYAANVRLVDDHVARLFKEARELGLLDDALIVFTADHGESLGEHGYYFGHGRLPHNAGSHVPLFVHWPGRLAQGRRVAQPVELLDLYPTLQALALPDTPPVPGLEGQSLLPLLQPAEPSPEDLARFRVAFSQAGRRWSPAEHFRSIQDRDWKLVYHPPVRHRETERPTSYQLYHLAEDPGETRDLVNSADEREELERLHRKLFEWMGDEGHWIRRARSESDSQSEETLRALRALGYVD